MWLLRSIVKLAMDLLIHVGLHKTGTTALQETLDLNYTTLLSDNILYPRTGLFLSQHALIPGTLFTSHHALDSVERSKDPQHYLDPLGQEVKQHEPLLTIISSEVFTEVSWNKAGCLGIIERLSRPFANTDILLTTRNVEGQALSSVCHILRDNMLGRCEDPVGLYFNMLKCLKTWYEFWQVSGLPITEKRLEDSDGNLVDYYIGDAIERYSHLARSRLRDFTKNQSARSPRSNADPYKPFFYLLAFILVNSSTSLGVFCKVTLQDIAWECGHSLAPAALTKLVTTRHLLGYLNTFRQIDLDSIRDTPLRLSIEVKIEAMANAGLESDTITQIIAIVNRLIQYYS